jgi:hypothetical protein
LNRSNRGVIDHDIMEGLPVRQWRKQNAVVTTQPQKEEAPVNNDPNYRWRELPMPRGSEMYSPWSQALLRAARRPRIPQLHSKTQDEDKDLPEEEKPLPEPDAIIETTKWSQLPRDHEQPEIEFLAKRRKGLPSLHEDPTTKQPMRKVKVKKVDAEGNAAVFDVLAPEGAVVEGELVKDEDVATETPAPGTVVEGVGVANDEGVVVASVEPVAPTPPRRGPPRPKRKAKGPGRGRKKRQTLSPSAAAAGSTNMTSDAGNEDEANGGTLKVPRASGDAASGTDVDMGEESAAKDGDDGSDDDDDDDREDASDMDGRSRSASPHPPKASNEAGGVATSISTSAAPNPQQMDAIGGISEPSLSAMDAMQTDEQASAIPSSGLGTGVPAPDIIKTTDVNAPAGSQPHVSTEPASATIPAEAPVMSEDPLPASMDPTAPPQIVLPVPDDPYPPAPPPLLEAVTAPTLPIIEPPGDAAMDSGPPAAPNVPLDPLAADSTDAMVIDTAIDADTLPSTGDAPPGVPTTMPPSEGLDSNAFATSKPDIPPAIATETAEASAAEALLSAAEPPVRPLNPSGDVPQPPVPDAKQADEAKVDPTEEKVAEDTG